MARIELDAVTKRYPDGTTAVRELDLDVTDGELLVLVGPSGCGKTTALRMVAGLEEVSGGTIYIDGHPVNDVEPRHRDIAMVFQSYALYPHLSVFDNMAFGLKYRREVSKEEIRRRVTAAAQTLELEPYLQRKPRQLSGGQRQRVAMGRAIVRQPRAFLMDEPLSNLDAKLRVQMRAEIARLQRSLGVTTIYVTHDQTEAMTLGSRVAVLQHGVLQQVASPQELYRRPVNVFVASFIGSPAMNLLPARLERGDGGLRAVFGAHAVTVPDRLVSEQPGLAGHVGRDVILGVRPEHLRDAALLADPDLGTVVELPVELREELGSEVHVHCRVSAQARPGLSAAALAADDDGDGAPAGRGSAAQAGAAQAGAVQAGAVQAAAAHRESLLVARMDAQTTIAEGQPARISVNLAAVHFFDPETGISLRG